LSVSPKLVEFTPTTRFMEETDVCYLNSSVLSVQQSIPNGCAAKSLPPSQRLQLGLHALAGTQPITELAEAADVSRKFVYQQRDRACRALDEAFHPAAADTEVLFYLPVTKQWLRQLILGLVLICHSPLRGVVELLRDLFDYHLSLGTVHNILRRAVQGARQHNHAQDLSRVRAGGHDEIYQAGQPVLVGVDLDSTYCYLLSLEEHCDGDTWGIRLLELQQRGLGPEFVVGDAGNALRAGLAEALPQTPCRSDVFHALKEMTEAVGKLENRAYEALQSCARWDIRIARDRQHGRPINASARKRRSDAQKKQAQALTLADDVALLGRWLRWDVLGLAGPPHADRLALYDFVVAELKARVAQAPAVLSRLVTYLEHQRDDLLHFASALDADLAKLAARFALPEKQVRALWAARLWPLSSSKRWYQEASLRQLLGARYFPLTQALDAVRRRTVRASSLVENLNSRLRNYFFLRRQLGNEYLCLLQFYFNHHRYDRSERSERVGKSPAELLSGQRHAHWLELLGYTRFSRN
jgi:hypothetical protein